MDSLLSGNLLISKWSTLRIFVKTRDLKNELASCAPTRRCFSLQWSYRSTKPKHNMSKESGSMYTSVDNIKLAQYWKEKILFCDLKLYLIEMFTGHLMFFSWITNKLSFLGGVTINLSLWTLNAESSGKCKRLMETKTGEY